MKWTRSMLRGSLTGLALLVVACGRDIVTSPSGLTARAKRQFSVTPSTSTIAPIGDTYLKSGTPNKNQGTETILRIQDSGNNRILVAFPTNTLEAAVGAGSIASATLRFTIADNGDNWGTTGRTISVHRLTSDWTELGATWNCAVDANPANSTPDCSGTTLWAMDGKQPRPWDSTATSTALIQSHQSGVVTLDVTADVRAFVDGSRSNFGWIVKKTEEGSAGRVDFASRETGNNGPVLMLVVNPPPPPAPTGVWGGTISEADPALGHSATYPLHINFATGKVINGACGNYGTVVSIASPTIIIAYPGCGTETVTFGYDGATLVAEGTMRAQSDGREFPVSYTLTHDPEGWTPPTGQWVGTTTLTDPANGNSPISFDQTVDFTAGSVTTTACGAPYALTDVTASVLRAFVQGCGWVTVNYAVNGNVLVGTGNGVASSDGRPIPATWALTRASTAPLTTVFSSDRATPGVHQIFAMSDDGQHVVRLATTGALEFNPVWSPDRSKIAYASERSGSRQIWVMNADGSNPVQLTSRPGLNMEPAWSPDGSQIAFTSNGDGYNQIYVMSADASNLHRLTSTYGDYHPTWSPYGNKIAFTRITSYTVQDIFVMNVDGTGAVALTSNTGINYTPAWSPDGQRIAFTSDRNGGQNVWVMLADGSNQLQLTNAATSYSPAWTPGSDSLLFASNRSGQYQIYRMSASGSGLTQVSAATTGESYGPNRLSPAALVPPAAFNLAGTWTYTKSNTPTVYVVTLTQSGSQISGTLTGQGPDYSQWSLTGTVQGNQFALNYVTDLYSHTMTPDYYHIGTISSDGNTIQGTLTWSSGPGGSGTFLMTRP